MCGACGVAAPSHWSAPFLASLPARTTAARAVAAMIEATPAVVGVPGGFLVRRPTGTVDLVPHLGAVWQALDRLGVPRPAATSVPPDVTGPVTLPPPRPALLDVHLVLTDGLDQEPADEELLDGRGVAPYMLLNRLRARARGDGPRVIRLLLDDADLQRVLPHLAADPAHPFQLCLDAAGRPGTVPVPDRVARPDSAGRIPPVLAWVSGREGQGQVEPLVTSFPAAPDRSFRLEMLRGVVTRCALEAAELCFAHNGWRTVGDYST